MCTTVTVTHSSAVETRHTHNVCETTLRKNAKEPNSLSSRQGVLITALTNILPWKLSFPSSAVLLNSLCSRIHEPKTPLEMSKEPLTCPSQPLYLSVHRWDSIRETLNQIIIQLVLFIWQAWWPFFHPSWIEFYLLWPAEGTSSQLPFYTGIKIKINLRSILFIG